MPEKLMVKRLSKDWGSRSIGAVPKTTGMQVIDVFEGLKQGKRKI
jgi:hypothetical protein